MEYTGERLTWLQQAVIAGLRQDEDLEFVKSYFEEHLDGLVARLALADNLTKQTFEQAVRVELGWEKDQVLEVEEQGRNGGHAEDILMQLRSGGLASRNHGGSTFRILTNRVERFGDLWLACSCPMWFQEMSTEEARALKMRPEIRALTPVEAPQTKLSAELGAAEALRMLSLERNVRGGETDRHIALLSFWEEAISLQNTLPAGHPHTYDIVHVRPRSRSGFHVAAHTFEASSGKLHCFDPRKLVGPAGDIERLGTLDTIRVKSNQLRVVLPASRYVSSGRHVSPMVCFALAARENLRLGIQSRKQA